MRLWRKAVLLASAALAAAALAASPAGAVSCSSSTYVGINAGNFATIQAAVNALPPSLSGPACVEVETSGTYVEQVTVANFTNNGSSITITAISTASVSVQPPSSSLAAFAITNASVNVSGINVVPSNIMTYGVFVSSPNVSISSVNVNDPIGFISGAGVLAADWTTISYTSVTMGGTNTIGYWLSGSAGTTVSFSSAATANASAGAALWLSGASSCTITSFFGASAGGNGALVDGGAHNNLIALSTITSAASGLASLHVVNASSNTITQSYVGASGSSYGAFLDSNSNRTVISQSMVAVSGTAAALEMNATSSNTVVRSLIAGGTGRAAAVDGSSMYNAIVLSTMANNSSSQNALWINAASSNTVSQSYISNPAGYAAFLNSGANYNTIDRSTMSSAGTGFAGLSMNGAASNTVTLSWMDDANGGGASLDTGSNGNTISFSTITGGGGGAFALFLNSASSNTLIGSYVASVTGSAVGLGNSNANKIVSSTMTSNDPSHRALTLTSSSSNTVTLSVMTNANGDSTSLDLGSNANTISFSAVSASGSSSIALLIDTGSGRNTISKSTMAASGTNAVAISFNGDGSTNTVTQSYMTSATGYGASLVNAAYDVISQSTMSVNTSNGDAALFLNGSSWNVISGNLIANPSGYAAYFNTGANYNTIVLSTLTSSTGGGGIPLSLNGASSNTITQSMMLNPLGGAAALNVGSNYNKITLSTASGGGSGLDALPIGGNYNTVSLSYVASTAGPGLTMASGAQFNTVSQTTMTTSAAGYYALGLFGASSNTITQSAITNLAGIAGDLNAGANGNTISLSTITSGSSGSFSLYLGNASSNTIAQDLIVNVGHGLYLDNLAAYNSVSLSTMTSSFAGRDALFVGGDYNAVSRSSMTNFAGIGTYIDSTAAGNTIDRSAMTGGTAAGFGLYLNGASSSTISMSVIVNPAGVGASVNAGASNIVFGGDYIQGSTAVYVSASTGTVIGGSVLVATNTAGSALQVDSNSSGLSLSSSVLTAGASGAAVYLSSDGGSLILSTNTLSGARYGVFADASLTGGRLFVTSNTIVPAVTGANNTYGLYLNGLTNGASVQNNTIAYRTAGSMGGFISFGLFAQGSSGLLIDHNRFDEPGMITGGSYIAVNFAGTTNSAFKFNDVSSTAPAPTNAFLLQAISGSSHLTVADNVFVSSFAASGSTGTVLVDGSSFPTFVSDYNDYYSSNAALGFSWNGAALQGLTAWRAASSQDGHSLSALPLWKDPGAGVEDFHPLSTVGRWNQAAQNLTFVDGAQSPTIDAGDPADGVGAEQTPNGARANQGSYGLTAEASESAPAAFPGCAATYKVGSGQTYGTISLAVAAIPGTPPAGKSCVVIEDGATYNEQVLVQNFTLNLSSIAIFADPSSGLTPAVNPPATSTAAFVLINSSVSVAGINIAPASAISYGVFSSSAYVQLSTVNVLDSAGKISGAGLSVSSWTTISYSTVNVGSAHALQLNNHHNTISFSSFTAVNASLFAVYLNASSSNNITNVFAYNPAGDALHLDTSHNNTVSLSTITSFSLGGDALYLTGSNSDLFTNDYIFNSAGFAVFLPGGGNNDTISFSTVVSKSGAAPTILLTSPSSFTIDHSFISATGNHAIKISGGDHDVISLSTAIGGGGFNGLALTGGLFNTVSHSYLASAVGTAVAFSAGANGNTISQSTMTTGTGTFTLYMIGAASNTVAGSFIINPVGFGAYFDTGSSNNTISLTTITVAGGGSSPNALVFNAASSNTVVQSYIADQVSTAVYMSGNASSNTISLSLLYSPQTYALFMQGGLYNTISASTMTGGAWLDVASAYNAISLSTMSSVSANDYALFLQTASSNTVSQSYIVNPNGGAAHLGGGAGTVNNTIDRSTITSASGAAFALSLSAASSNTITRSFILSAAGNGAVIDNVSSRNTISLSSVSIPTGSGFGVSVNNGSSSNTITQTYVNVPGGLGVYITVSNYNTVSFSTASNNTASVSALKLDAASYNTISGNVVLNGGGYALELVNAASSNTVSGNSAASGAVGFAGMIAHTGTSANVFSGDYFTAASGLGALIGPSADNNVVFQSTITGGGAVGGLIVSGAGNGIYNSYVQGSTAVFVNGSTGTVIGGSALVATNTFGSALSLNTGSVGLSLSSSVLTAPASGAGVYLAPAGGGLIVLSTNTISGARYGVFAAAQAAGTQVWIASNTILPGLTTVNNTFGVWLSGLTTGATIQNNTVTYRARVAINPSSAVSMLLENSSGVVVDHNRLDNPGMVLSGGFIAAEFFGTTNSTFRFNDVSSTGTPTTAGLLEALGGSSHLTVANNVFVSSFATTGSSVTLIVDGATFPTFVADYNDYYSSNAALSFSWNGVSAQGLAAWQTTSGQDAHSISAPALWKDPGVGVEDFHPLSTTGRFNPPTQTFVNDGATALTIDAADPAEPFALEPAPNGGRANLGSYGGTPQASGSGPFPGCSVSKKVGSGQAFATISAAVASLPAALPPGKACVVIADGATYAEQVTVANFTMSASSIAIFADPSSGLTPTVAPGASLAGFVIANASVSVTGINVAPTGAVSYGVLVSSSYVSLTSMTVTNGAGTISAAGVAASSWTTINYVNVALGGASAGAGFLLQGSTMSSVSFSTASTVNSLNPALWLNGASSNTFTRDFFTDANGFGAYLTSGANFNTITRSTMTSAANSFAGLYLTASSSNTVAQSYAADPAGSGVGMDGGSSYNAVGQSTMASAAGGQAALLLSAAANNTINGCLMLNPAGFGAEVNSASTFNTITHSTITAGVAASPALFIGGASSNTVVGSVVTNAVGDAVQLSGANYNALTQSVFTGGGLGHFGLFIGGSSFNSVSQTFMISPSGTGADLDPGANANTIDQSTMTGNLGAGYGLYFNGASSNSITRSYMFNPSGYGTALAGGSTNNTIGLSTTVSNNAGVAALYLLNASSNTILQSLVINPGGNAAEVFTGANGNTISRSTMTSNVAAGLALLLDGGTANTVTQSYMNNPAGTALSLNGVTGDTVSQSTIASNAAGNAALSLFLTSSNTFTGNMVVNSAAGSAAAASSSFYNNIALSTFTTGGAVAFQLVGGATNTLSGVYVQGQTGVSVSGSTGTVIAGSTLFGAALYGLQVGGGSTNLTVSSSTIYATATSGFAVNLVAGNTGLTIFSTNTIYSMIAGSMPSGSQLFITSNTIIPILVNGTNSFGLYLNTFGGGAVVRNNTIAFRVPGNMGGLFAFGLFAPSGTGAVIDHNRIDNPGMVSNGSFIAVEFAGATNTTFKYNDVYSTNTGLTNAYLVEVLSGSTGLTMKDNIFVSSFAVSGASATVVVDAASLSGFAADYNDYFSQNAALGFVYGVNGTQGLAGWKAASSQDAHALSAGPLFANPGTGIEDFHPLSTVGRWNQAAQNFSNVDASQSPTIDAGDPADGVGAEPAPNGGLANMGSYGLTAEASEAILGFAGCALTKRVGGGQPFATISAAVSSLPSSLPPGKSCVVIEDGAFYSEQVKVQNFTMSGSSIAIFADPGTGLTPIVVPPTGNPAFSIANASVSVTGINIQPIFGVPFAIAISSPYVSISSVNVIDMGGSISGAGILASSWTTISYTSVTVTAATASAFKFPGSVSATVSFSTGLASTGSGYSLWLNGASSCTVTQSRFFNPGGIGARIDAGAAYNTVSLSTMSGGPAFNAMFVTGATFNTISKSFMTGVGGAGLDLDVGADNNTVSQSTVSVNLSGGSAVFLSVASSNTIDQSLFLNPSGTGVRFASGSNYNTISQSTITSAAASFPALHVTQTRSNTFTGDYVQGSTAVYVSGSTGTVIGGSRLAATAAAGSAFQMDGGSNGLALSSSVLTAQTGGAAVFLASNGGTMFLSTNTLSGARYGVFVDPQTGTGAQLWIASNTIVPGATNAANTYGVYLNGLASGATIQNNAIVYRTPGTVFPSATLGLFAQNSKGLIVDHNRIDDPGMVTGGSFVAVQFSGTTNSAFKFNDVNSSGPALTNAFVFQALNTSTGLTVKDNVFSSSFTAPGVGNSSATITVDATSAVTYASDYNDYFSSNAALGFQWGAVGAQGLAGWHAATSQDANSISLSPRWFNPSAGAEDFHQLSFAGRFSGGSFVSDGFTSGLIDAADPSEPVGAEAAPSGGRANLGSYGQTAEASKTPAFPTPSIFAIYASSISVAFPAIAADGYTVTASTAANFTGTLFSSSTTNGGATALAPQGLTPDSTYFLQTLAHWGDYKALSATVLSSATLAAAPGVAVPTYSLVTTSNLLVNWTVGGNPVGVATYTVVVTTEPFYPNADGGNSSITTTLLAASLSASPNTTYYAFASAVNWAGLSTAYTALGSTSTLVASPATAVTTFTAVASSSMTVNWSANGNPLGITTYTVVLSTASDFNAFATSFTFSTAPTAGPSATFTGLAAFTTYYFEVRAKGNNGLFTGFVPLGSTQTATIFLTPPPPAGLVVNSSSITATWGLVPGATGYNLVASLSATNPPVGVVASSAPVGVTATTATLNGLTPNTTVFLFVQATGLGAASLYSSYAATSTLAATPLTAVSTFSSVALTSFTVTWNANGNALSITTYTVQASTASDFNAFAASVTFSTVPAAGPSASLGGLTANTSYFVRVRAINNEGVATPFTVLGSTLTGFDATPPSITNLQAGDTTWRKANTAAYNVTFADATTTHLVKFQVKASTTIGGAGTDLVPFTDVVVGLSPLDTYTAPWALPAGVFNSLLEGVTNYISVRVFNGLGNNAFLQDAFFVKKDTTAPSIVNNQAGDATVRSAPGTTYAVQTLDGASGLAAFQYSASVTPGAGDASLIPWTDIATLSNTTFYQTPWAVSPSSFALLASGVTNYISVRSWDVAGTTASVVDAFFILKDTAGPSVAISSPTNGSFAPDLSSIAGTAASLFPIQGTEVSVQANPPGGLYWNPGSGLFNSAGPVYMPATGTTAWTLAAGIPATDGTSYRVVARSSTTFNQYSTTYATSTFVIDSSTPTVGVVAPVPSSTVSTLPFISGTALDPGGSASGLAAVEVRLRRNTDGLWWNWFTANWGAVAVSTVATGTTNWTLAPTPLLVANLANGTSYFIAVRASDNATPPNQGNFFVQGATFTWQDVTPPATIADLAAVSGPTAGQIALTWTTPGDDGGAGLLLTGQYSIFYSTTAATVASTTTAQVFFSTSLATPGALQTYTLTGLTTSATYFVRVALADTDGNWSAFSNQASSVATPAPFNAIIGHVVDLSTNGITGVEVECWDSLGNAAATTFTLADGSGTYSLSGLSAGNYKIRVTWTVNGVSSSLTQDNIAMGSFGVDFVLEINYALATLTGTLGALTTSSVGGGGGFGVSAYHGAAAFASSHIELFQTGRQVARVSVQSAGRWTIPHLLPGTYAVRAYTGLSYTAFQNVTLTEGDVVTLDFAEDPLPVDSVFAFPNPARYSTTIRFQTGTPPSQAVIDVFDIGGNLVREIPGDQIQAQPDGVTYHAPWDLTNSKGQAVASGVYLFMVKVKGGSGAQLGKVVKKLAVVR